MINRNTLPVWAVLFALGITVCYPAHAKITTASACIAEWEKVRLDPDLHPAYAHACIKVPGANEDMVLGDSYAVNIVSADGESLAEYKQFVGNGILCWALTGKTSFVSRSANTTSFQSLSALEDGAKNTAEHFIARTWGNGTSGRSYTSTAIRDNKVVVTVYGKFRDVVVRYFEVTIDLQGRIIDFAAIPSYFTPEVMAAIPLSMGEMEVKKKVAASLHDLNCGEATAFKDLYREMRVQPGNTPVLSWQGTVERSGAAGAETSWFTYDEATEKCTYATWSPFPINRNTEEAPAPRALRFLWDACWGPQSAIWVTWVGKWDGGGSPWMDDGMFTNSLAIGAEDKPFAVYRPFSSLANNDIVFDHPCPSPDGRWVACFANGVLAAVDLRSGRMHTVTDRSANTVSWNADSSALLYTSNNKLYLSQVGTSPETPFSTQLTLSEGATEVGAAEFIADKKDAVVVVYRTRTAKGGAGPWRVGLTTVLPGQKITIKDVAQIGDILRAHVLPSGESLWALTGKDVWSIDLQTGKKSLVSWLKDRCPLDKGLVLDLWYFNWSFSPDGTRIVFTSGAGTPSGQVGVCTANVDGTQIRCVALPDMSVLPPTYTPEQEGGQQAKMELSWSILAAGSVEQDIMTWPSIPPLGPLEKQPGPDLPVPAI
jgi:hypothetical protein